MYSSFMNWNHKIIARASFFGNGSKLEYENVGDGDGSLVADGDLPREA